MRKRFVYADPHFGHENILTYAQRPWTDIHKHDHDLVKLYNSVVGKNDEVYWLGDVTLKGAEKLNWLRGIISKMNGTKHLIFGNHDNLKWAQYLDVGFTTVHSFLELNWQGQDLPATLVRETKTTQYKKLQNVRLCHDPAWAQDRNYLWVCGHLHNCAFTAPTHIAIVCVELTEYKPVLLDEIIEGRRPGEGVLRTAPRPNREPKAWTAEKRREEYEKAWDREKMK